jgi:hypothetical protein
MMRFLPLALCALLAGCAGKPSPLATCRSDLECSENEICFPEGCADPGGGLVVEVQSSSRIGAQDFPITDGGVAPTIDFKLLPPSNLTGEFQRNGLFYGGSVSLKVKGQSELIPGVVRNYQETFVKPERGTFRLAVGAGRYSVTAEAADSSVPPEAVEVTVAAGGDTQQAFQFAPTDATIALTGRLLKRIDTGSSVPEIPVLNAAMDVQAFDPMSRRPLSQRVPASSGTAGSNGDFTLFIAPEAYGLESFVIIASPREPGSLVPSKTFTITQPVDPDLRLQLGEFGDPLPQMRGLLRTSAGAPVVGASVYLEGPVTGGGVFRSKVVTTDVDGVFKVDLLPSSTDGSYVLTALPPPTSAAGVVQKSVRAISKPGTVAFLQVVGASDLERDRVVCPDKFTVIGTLLRPGSSDPTTGTPAIGATVIARAVEQLKELGNQPLPMGDTEVLTDESGRFSLELDPGVYQLDFIPGEDLPRTTRLVTVRAVNTAGLDGGMPSRTIDLKGVELRKGRKVTGTVTAPNLNGELGFAVNATVRFFRVNPVEGNTTSLLLAEAVTDSLGNYTVMLPTK